MNLNIDYKAYGNMIFKVWIKMCAVILALYGIIMVAFVKGEAIIGWFSEKIDRIRSKFKKETVDFSEEN